MVRYRRKSDRGKYGQAALNEAIRKVKAGEISKRKAEQMFGVPRKTLTRHILGEVKKPGNLGRFECVLPVEIEEAVVNHAIKLQRMLFGLSTADLQRLAFEIAERQKIPHCFKGKMAGNSWLRGFLARHPNLAVRCPEPTSIQRAIGFNAPSKQAFFKLYGEELQKNSFTPDRIFNVDESGLTVVHRPGKVLAQKGEKQVGKITSGEKGDTMTIVCTMSATGVFVPPMLIFKRKRMTELLLRGSPAGSIGGCSVNGWIDSTLFVRWLQHFIEHTKASTTHKVLLVLDGHSSHKSLEAIELARRSGVTMICLPPHTTHRMQPLDLTVYGPLKKNYNRECDKWMITHPGRRITPFDQAALFGSAYVNTMTMDKAVTGFESPGLWPFNPDKIPDEDCVASLVTDEPLPSTAGNSSSPSNSISASTAAGVTEPTVSTKKTTTATRKSTVGHGIVCLLVFSMILHL